MMTYGDGVADVDFRALLAFHEAHGKLATVTAVQPPAASALLISRTTRMSCASFMEKPQR